MLSPQTLVRRARSFPRIKCNAVLWQSDHFTADVMQHAGLLLRMVIFIANRSNGGQRKESSTIFFLLFSIPASWQTLLVTDSHGVFRLASAEFNSLIASSLE
jgi:hypothetical protein